MNTSQLYSTTSSGAAMGDSNQGNTSSTSSRRRSREIETLSMEIRKYPRDLHRSYLSTDANTSQQSQKSAMEEHGDDGDVELNLGLSLGGRFGVDKSHRGLVRASSIAGTIPSSREESESVAPTAAKVTALVRTSSLPSETEEEWRRRKELQTLRRMEARRRRSEKQKSIRESSTGGGGAAEDREGGFNLNFRGRLEREQQHLGIPGKPNPGIGLPSHWSASTRQRGIGGVVGKGGFFGSLQGLLAQQQQQEGCSQGSVDSQGGSSSGVSERESKTHQGSGSGSEAKSPASIQSMQERGSQETGIGSSSGSKHGEGSGKQPDTSDHTKKEAGAGGIEDMPSVFTIGDGPNGRKVDGILYKYGKGEEVRIMCICHGSFFSPSEFVNHAGGSDVEHPLRHIVVNPSSSLF